MPVMGVGHTPNTSLFSSVASPSLAFLLDDRSARPGVLFADNDLIGIPHRLVISERNLDQGLIEYKGRCDETTTLWPLADVHTLLAAKLQDDNR
jgi:prolyl-tRNA synthetase